MNKLNSEFLILKFQYFYIQKLNQIEIINKNNLRKNTLRNYDIRLFFTFM